jgi:hypothetical protein
MQPTPGLEDRCIRLAPIVIRLTGGVSIGDVAESSDASGEIADRAWKTYVL